jgi:hypothetical protein
MMKFCLLWLNLLADLLRFLVLGLRSKSSLAAENLFLRKQLAFYQERTIMPRRSSHSTRLALVKAIKALAAAETKSLIQYIERFRAGVPPQTLASMGYSSSVFLVPKTAHRAVKMLQSNRKLRLGRTSLNLTIKGESRDLSSSLKKPGLEITSAVKRWLKVISRPFQVDTWIQ